MDFIESFIKKWEAHYGCRHKGHVELNKEPHQVLEYYDDRFVKDLLRQAAKLHTRSKKLEAQAEEYLKELKDAVKDSKISREVDRVDRPGPPEEETYQEEGAGDDPLTGETDLSYWGEGIPEGMSVSHQVSGKELHNTGGDQAEQ